MNMEKLRNLIVITFGIITAFGVMIWMSPESLNLSASIKGPDADPAPIIQQDQTATNTSAKVQLAILLDTSGSMDGLIDQARGQLWKIVNEFATAEKDGVNPELEIALFEYGKSSLTAESGYVRMISPLTYDLDKISEELFALRTNGGDEYCGKVIKDASQMLDWSNDPDHLKFIFIAGNEPFDQGSWDFRESCKDAISKGIIVNTIFCGNEAEGINSHWKTGADIADGQFLVIDHNVEIVHVSAPQDAEIQALNQQLNNTYIPYGQEGERKKMKQEEQDKASAGFGSGNTVLRAFSKSNSVYRNESWDLVDGVTTGTISTEDLKDLELPAEMEDMDTEELEEYVQERADERAEIQQKIKELYAERQEWLDNQAPEEAEETLDRALMDAVKTKAAEKSYTFK